MSLLDTLGLSPAALAERRRSIGGSDANVIMSGDPAKLIGLWQEKRGEPGEDLSDVLAVQMGSYTEPFNAAWFTKQTGLYVHSRGEVMRRPGDPPMHFTMDGLVYPDADSPPLGLFEAKHVGTRTTDADLFARYVPQLTHGCIVTGERRAWLSCFKGNGDWVVFEYELNDAYALAVMDAERAFWACVISGEPPAPLPPVETPKPVGVKEYDMDGSNVWAVQAAEYLETWGAANRHEAARKELKALVPADASKAHGHGVAITRDKRGALRFATIGE